MLTFFSKQLSLGLEKSRIGLILQDGFERLKVSSYKCFLRFANLILLIIFHLIFLLLPTAKLEKAVVIIFIVPD